MSAILKGDLRSQHPAILSDDECRARNLPRELGPYRIDYVPPSALVRTEKHSVNRALSVSHRITGRGFWTKPVLVERETLAVMDGHHRRAASFLLELDLVPVIAIYYDDPRLTVHSLRPKNWDVTPELILEKGRSGDVYPYKTTRHTLSEPIPEAEISVYALGLKC